MKKGLQRSICSMLLCFCLLPGLCARAEEPESIRDRKGTAPAEGTWLDEQFDADPSAFENQALTVERVRIGIRYGEDAVTRADFENLPGLGFRYGVYDDNRSFIERGTTDAAVLSVACAAGPDKGLMLLDGRSGAVLYLSDGEDSLALEPVSGLTRYGEDRYRGGFECRRLPDSRMTVINCVALEDYVKGVVPYEMGANWPMEALKAQAVCARTYVVYNQNQYADEGFDISDDTESQVYRGTGWANEQTDAAVNETRGQVLRYRGEICRIYYFAADGGATEDGRAVFDADLPYLLGKRDPFESAMDFRYQSWRESWTGEQISALLWQHEHPIDTIAAIEPEISAVGNVTAMTFRSESGKTLRLTGRECYTVLYLPSCHFTLTQNGFGFFSFEGGGLGHNCGMSQWGARAMDEVYGYSYRQILAFYFTGAYVA